MSCGLLRHGSHWYQQHAHAQVQDRDFQTHALLASILHTLAREFRAVTKTDKTHQERKRPRPCLAAQCRLYAVRNFRENRRRNGRARSDLTYAGGFPEDYSDVFGAPAAALPAF